MAQRLCQLESALGEHSDTPPPAHSAVSRNTNIPAKHGTARTLIACLLSAALGASAMWLIMVDRMDASAAQQPSVIVTVPPTAIVSPATLALPESAPVIAHSVPDERQIGDMVESWRQAWQSHDLSAYLGAYGAAFTPADGSSRDAWVAARSKKLAGNATIKVQLHNMVFERLEQDRFNVSFQQDYTSGSYREVGRGKSLLVARENGEWKIIREQQTR